MERLLVALVDGRLLVFVVVLVAPLAAARVLVDKAALCADKEKDGRLYDATLLARRPPVAAFL